MMLTLFNAGIAYQFIATLNLVFIAVNTLVPIM